MTSETDMRKQERCKELAFPSMNSTYTLKAVFNMWKYAPCPLDQRSSPIVHLHKNAIYLPKPCSFVDNQIN